MCSLDHQGLGFSLTSNDAPTGDLPGPLYVQEILQNGAAMKSGKLAVGDKYVIYEATSIEIFIILAILRRSV